MRSRSTVDYQLVELETKQAIVREPRRARGIRLALPARAATTCCSRRLSGRCSTDGGGSEDVACGKFRDWVGTGPP